MSIQSPLGVNRLARTKEVLGITALEAATPVTNAGAEGVVTAASYAAAGEAVDTATNIVHILAKGKFERTSISVSDITYGVDSATNSGWHDGETSLVFDNGSAFILYVLRETTITPRFIGMVGDTSIDSHSILPNLFTLASALKAEVYIPEGEWAHESKITLPDNIKIRGAGASSIFVSTFVNTPSSSDSVGIAVGSGNTIESVHFKQAVAATTRKNNSNSQMVFGNAKSNFILKDITVSNSPAAGILLQTCSNYSITNCEIYGTLADGIHSTHTSNNFDVSHNYVHNVGDDCIAVVSYDDGTHAVCYSFSILNNKCFDGDARGITVLGGEKGKVSLNEIEGCGGGIYVIEDAAYTTFPCDDIKVSLNSITNCGDGANGLHAFWASNSENITFELNDVTDSTHVYFLNCNGLKARLNNVSGYKDAKSGFLIRGNTDFNISSNEFKGTYSMGMEFSVSTNTRGRVDDNTFQDCFDGASSVIYGDITLLNTNTEIYGTRNISINSSGADALSLAGTYTNTSITFTGSSLNWLDGYKEYLGVSSLVWNPNLPKPHLNIDFNAAQAPDQNRASYRKYLLYYSTLGIPANYTLATHEKAVLTFNTGNGTEPIVGETITLGTATGTVTAVSVSSGTFAGGDAAGTISITVTLNAFFAGAATASGGATFTVSSINYAGYKLLSFTAIELNSFSNVITSVAMSVTSNKPTITWTMLGTCNVGIKSNGAAVYN